MQKELQQEKGLKTEPIILTTSRTTVLINCEKQKKFFLQPAFSKTDNQWISSHGVFGQK